MEYAVLALPLVFMVVLFALERVERWMDEDRRPRTVSVEITPVPQRPRAAQRSALVAAHHGARWRPIRLVGELARARVHYRHTPTD